MPDKESSMRVLGKELRPHAIWAFIVWTGSLAGSAMIAVLYAWWQRAEHLPVQWWLFGGLFLLSFSVFSGGIYVARKMVVGKQSSQPSAESSLTVAADTWAEQMAEDDAKNIRKRVREISPRKEFHFGSGSDPYLDIITELWNGSVFQLVSFGEIAGHVKYAGKQLAGEPRVIVSVEPPLLSLGHGDSVTLTVRQYLSTQIADMMEANRNRGIAIDFESVFVSFKILPLDGLTKMDTFRWQGPAKFAIEDTIRV